MSMDYACPFCLRRNNSIAAIQAKASSDRAWEYSNLVDGYIDSIQGNGSGLVHWWQQNFVRSTADEQAAKVANEARLIANQTRAFNAGLSEEDAMAYWEDPSGLFAKYPDYSQDKYNLP